MLSERGSNLWYLLAASLMLNLLTVLMLASLGFAVWARLDAAGDTLRRCDVGIRWVERYKDQGKIIAVDKDAMEELKKEVIESEYRVEKLR